MRRTIIFLSLLMLACFSASATTNITSCGFHITAAGSYSVTNDLSHTGSGDCILIDSLVYASPYYVNLDCGGHTISDTSSMPAGYLLRLVGNHSGMYVDVSSCNFSLTNSNSYPSIDMSDEYVQMQYNTFTNAGLALHCASGSTEGATVDWSNFYDSIFVFDHYYYAAVLNNVVSDSSSSGIGNGVLIAYPSAFIANNNTITGSSTTTGLDDGITVVCASSGCRMDGIKYNTISKVFDAGIEFLGYVAGLGLGDDVSHNDISYFGFAGIGHYYGTSESSIAYVTNSFSHASSGAGLYLIFGADTGFIFRDISVTGTTFDNSNSMTNAFAVDFSYPAAARLYFANNNFGGSVLIGTPAGITTDGGSNYCTSIAPTGAITCH